MPLHPKAGDGDLVPITEPALLTRRACISHEIYHPALVLESKVTFNILFFGWWVFFLLHNQLSLITWRLHYIELACLALVSRGWLATGLSCTSQSSRCNCSVRSYCHFTLHWMVQVYISVKGMWLEGKGTFTRQWCAKNGKVFPLHFRIQTTTLSKQAPFTRIHKND